MTVAYLSLGSNIGDRLGYLQFAVESLSKQPNIFVESVSSVYQTAPYGYLEQDDFLNIAVRIKTTLLPIELLDTIQDIEKRAHRKRNIHWGPRTLDIDIIWYEGVIMSSERLNLPHIEAHKRLFVLLPLKEVWQAGTLNGKKLDYWIQNISSDQEIAVFEKDWSSVMKLEKNTQEVIEEAVSTILKALGEDVTRSGLVETPKRVASMYQELFSGLVDPVFNDYKLFESNQSGEMILIKDIQFYSMCEHHLLPFWGVAHVAYIPSKNQVLGLSKLARLVEYCAARPSVQEELTTMIGEGLVEHVPVKGVAVSIEAEHMCMTMRGVRTPHSTTKTYYYYGEFKKNNDWRNEFLSEVKS